MLLLYEPTMIDGGYWHLITLVLGNSQSLASLIICFSTTINEAHRVLQLEIQAECPKTVRARSLWHRWPNQTCLAGGTMPVGSGPNARGESFNMSSLHIQRHRLDPRETHLNSFCGRFRFTEYAAPKET